LEEIGKEQQKAEMQLQEKNKATKKEENKKREIYNETEVEELKKMGNKTTENGHPLIAIGTAVSVMNNTNQIIVNRMTPNMTTNANVDNARTTNNSKNREKPAATEDTTKIERDELSLGQLDTILFTF
jgi:ATP-dependent 26S proteasome regulatory subunit